MPKFLMTKYNSYQLLAFIAISIVFVIVISFYNLALGLIAFVFVALLTWYAVRKEILFRKELLEYIATLSHRVKKVGDEALMEIPIGIILYDDEFRVEWMNTYAATCFEDGVLVGNTLNHISTELIPLINKKDAEREEIELNKRIYEVHMKRNERLLYFFDVTEERELKKRYQEEQIVFAIVYLDNYDELTQGMDDTARSNINSQVTDLLNRWAVDHGVYLKRSSSEKFFAVFNERTLSSLEKTKFSLLDEVREFTSKLNVPITLSIGVGCGTADFQELGQLAQSGLDLALGRGGDQVAIKQMNGKVKFYGGKTNPIEKRTRVRARVISHALRELVLDSDKVLIMGHKRPDMDAIGAAIGILKVAQANEKEGYIIFDKNEKNIGIEKLMEKVKEDNSLWSRFIQPEEALEMLTSRTLLVVVDTHKPSLVIEEKLINRIDRVVVIDHHRRGEDFISEPVLVYMEPYASSTSELVTELFEYQPKRLKLNMLESTALLAGITVDTKNFTLRTGSRTFDAASYLRSRGADTILVQKFLSEDLQQFIQRSKIIEKAEIYRNGIVIAKGEPDKTYDQVLIAQTADTLLSINNVAASFVISKRTDGKISISARSLGDVNVQVIMEALNGGGHLTNAAAQLEGGTMEEAEGQLKQIIDDYFQEIEGGDDQ
ncbi:hypothetical protein DCC39_17395 [Pueribacillus theae]|uniref:Cyclic-di-AMP phosphodiesterase n=1 Tax=Pueribacillus theae TaxID=2171751 RepID=A0A2U1JNR4_9BACI|nr:DHH family phosphoesterase [Pueribacillus theae]PWA06635.1 hypothetical protein DCC39_17395 [Pueribacillus theae]